MSELRPYRGSDRDAVYDVCVRTGAAGQDATGRYSDDDLLPAVYAGPYLLLEPELAFVLDDGQRAVGYVLGTADTARYVRAVQQHWLPRVAGRHPEPSGPPTTPDEQLRAVLHHPERMLHPELADHPAHLHVDLLPEHQGAGHGRRLVLAFLRAAAAAGAPGVTVGVDPTNAGALRFYDRLGFARVAVAGSGAVHLVRSTS